LQQGRLDVHIPLFPPETEAERRALLLAVARKIKVPLTEADLASNDILIRAISAADRCTFQIRTSQS